MEIEDDSQELTQRTNTRIKLRNTHFSIISYEDWSIKTSPEDRVTYTIKIQIDGREVLVLDLDSRQYGQFRHFISCT